MQLTMFCRPAGLVHVFYCSHFDVVDATVLFDTGSDRSYITTDLVVIGKSREEARWRTCLPLAE